MQSAHTQSYALPAVLDAIGAVDATEHLLEALQAGAALQLDASQVVRITTPGVQFLVAVRAQAEAAGSRLALLASPALLGALELLGLTPLFQPHFEESV
jgi:anti-anti-sigma regulatory factor